jgi:hypothetical protein
MCPLESPTGTCSTRRIEYRESTTFHFRVTSILPNFGQFLGKTTKVLLALGFEITIELPESLPELAQEDFATSGFLPISTSVLCGAFLTPRRTYAGNALISGNPPYLSFVALVQRRSLAGGRASRHAEQYNNLAFTWKCHGRNADAVA